MEKQDFFSSIDRKMIYIFLALACFLAYANSLGGDFVFDDTMQIVDNRSLASWSNLLTAFTTDVWAFQKDSVKGLSLPYYRPLFTIYLTVGYQLFGFWQQGWHLFSVAIHTGATFLVYALFLRLTGENRRLSIIGAVLFALIPIHVESVSWISGIPDPLSALFYIPAIIFYIRWRTEKSGNKYLFLSLTVFLLALLCKETPIILPLVLIVWEISRDPARNLTDKFLASLKRILIFVFPAAFYLAVRFFALGNFEWHHPINSQTPAELVYATAPEVVFIYLKNIIFPFDLSLIYDTRFVTGFSDVLFWLPLLGLAGLGILIYLFKRKLTPPMWMALALFFIPLLPVLNLTVFHYKYIVQDRYLYLPSIGFTLFLACLIEKLWASGKPILRKAAPVIAILLSISYLLGTVRQNRVWNSSITLWTKAAVVEPNWWAIHYNLGLAYYLNKNYEDARQEFDTALNLPSFDRQDGLIYNNRGLAKKALGNNEEAKKDFLKVLEAEPQSVEAITNLGTVFFEQGNYIEAEKQFKKGLEINPSETSLIFNLARTWAKLGRHNDAILYYEKLLKMQKKDAELMYYAAVSYARVGQNELARKMLADAEASTSDEKLRQQISDELKKN